MREGIKVPISETSRVVGTRVFSDRGVRNVLGCHGWEKAGVSEIIAKYDFCG